MFYSVMDPHRSFSNSIVKGYSGEDTKRGAFWENNTMSKFIIKNRTIIITVNVRSMENVGLG